MQLLSNPQDILCFLENWRKISLQGIYAIQSLADKLENGLLKVVYCLEKPVAIFAIIFLFMLLPFCPVRDAIEPWNSSFKPVQKQAYKFSCSMKKHRILQQQATLLDNFILSLCSWKLLTASSEIFKWGKMHLHIMKIWAHWQIIMDHRFRTQCVGTISLCILVYFFCSLKASEGFHQVSFTTVA